MAVPQSDAPKADLQSLESMQDKLDSLWEKHLVLLDQYDQAQQQIQKHMSSGFFSLAQASFKSTSRTRYGQDYYDERMQATRKCYATLDADRQSKYVVRSVGQEASNKEDDTNNDKKVEDKDEQLPTPPATPLHDTDVPNVQLSAEPANHEKKDDTPGEGTEDTEEKEKTKKPTNPLHWYGILVPPQLRQAQTSFAAAIEDPIANAVNAAQAMKKIEVDIRRLRKDIKKAEKKTASVVDK